MLTRTPFRVDTDNLVNLGPAGVWRHAIRLGGLFNSQADGHGFASTTAVMTSSPSVGVGVGVRVGDGDGDGDGNSDSDGEAPCNTVAVGTTGGDPAGTPAGFPAVAVAEGAAMPGDVATLDDRIGRGRVVGWSAPDTVDPAAGLLPGLAADA